MRSSNNFLQRLWGLFQPQTRNNRRSQPDPGSIVGSQYPTTFALNKQIRWNLEVEEIPIRPIMNDLGISRELIEMKTWSYEARHSISFASRDCFQRSDGSSASWFIPREIEEYQVHPDVIAIGVDLSRRYCGKTLILGGSRLERAARDMMWSGDSFLELAIEREGIGSNDYGISKSLYLPSLSVFVDEDNTGYSNGFWQRAKTMPSPEDIWIHPLKMLHFCLEERELYGQSILLQSLEPWRKLKEVAIDLEEASRAIGVTPWLHIMPEGRDEIYKQAYQDDIESKRRSAIITDMFLLNGADIRKASTDSNALQPLIDHYLLQRMGCIPAVIPTWAFPYLSLKDGAQKDLSSQPAMAYARFIHHLRSIIGEQVKWAISVEIVLKKGWDWFEQNGYFEVHWQPFVVSELEAFADAQNDTQDDEDTNNAPDNSQDAESMQRLLLDASVLLTTPNIEPSDRPTLESLQKRTNALLLKYPNNAKLRKTASKLIQISRELCEIH